MLMVSQSVYFYGLLIAGIVFIAIGLLSIYYSNSSVKVDVDGIIKPDSRRHAADVLDYAPYSYASW